MNDTKISVIVPAYQVEAWLERCVESLRAQTHQNMEIILVDDGSRDGTLAVAEKLAALDPRIVVVSQENAGVTAARLKGVSAATGDYIGFVDGDDWVESDLYELLLRNAKAYDADISHCGYQMVFADGRVHYFYNSGVLRQQNRQQGLQDLLEGTLVEPGLCNKLFRKSLFPLDVMDKSIKNNEDLLMNYLLFAQSRRSVFQDVCKYHYMVRGNSASRAPLNQHRIYDPIRVRQIIREQGTAGVEEAADRAYVSACVNAYNLLMLERSKAFRAEEPKVRDFLRESRDQISLLSKKQQLLAKLILGVPGLYRYVYRFYARYLLTKRYE